MTSSGQTHQDSPSLFGFPTPGIASGAVLVPSVDAGFIAFYYSFSFGYRMLITPAFFVELILTRTNLRRNLPARLKCWQLRPLFVSTGVHNYFSPCLLTGRDLWCFVVSPLQTGRDHFSRSLSDMENIPTTAATMDPMTHARVFVLLMNSPSSSSLLSVFAALSS